MKTLERTDKPSDLFFTPDWLVDEILEFYDGEIDLDPSADCKKHIPANQHYTFEDNGLEKPWFGKVFCNPPYSKSKFTSLELWVRQALIHQACCQTNQCLLLIPANTDTKWAQMLLKKKWGSEIQKTWISILFFEGRISFLNADYEPSRSSGRFASMMVYLGDDRLRFTQQFKKFGTII